MNERIFDELIHALLSLDTNEVVEASKKALSLGADPIDIVDRGLGKGLRIIGKKYEEGELFVMHMLLAAYAVQRAISDVIEPKIMELGKQRKSLGKVVIGTVEGDIHDIGKNIVATMLTVTGFEVHNLGRDVPVERFIEKAKEVNANIIAASTLVTTSMEIQRRIVEEVKKEGLRGKIRILVGGAQVTRDWAEEIGADGYGYNAVEAVRVAKRLLSKKK